MERKFILVTSIQNLGPFLRVFGQLQGDTMKLIQAQIDSALKENAYRPQFTELCSGQFCLAKVSGGKFSRARVKSLSMSDFISVSFVDYGTEERVRINEIRLLPPNLPKNEFLKSVQSQLCAYILGGIFDDWNDYQLNEISNIACNQLVEIQTLLEIPRFCFIKIILHKKSLVEYLINEKNIGKSISLEKQKEVFQQISNKTRVPTGKPGSTMYSSGVASRPDPRDIMPPRQLHSIMNAKSMNTTLPTQMSFNHIRMQGPTTRQTIGPRFYGYNAGFLPIRSQPPPANITSRGSYGMSMTSYGEYNASQPSNFQTSFIQTSPVKSSVATFKSNTLMVGQLYSVTCCLVENGPCLFSVHLESEIMKLNTMMNELENTPLKNISQRPSIGMACIARFSEDGNLYRAVIMSIKPTACQVAYVDYGNTELVSFTDLYEIPPMFLEHKIFAIRFALSGYKDLEPLDDQIKQHFRDMIFQKRLMLKVVPLEGPPLVQYCELYDNKVNVLDVLMQFKNKRLTYGPPQPLSHNSVVVIRYVESPKKFFVQNVENIPAFDNLMDELFLHCRKSKNMILRYLPGTACAVKFENAWYRAEILGENGNRVHIRHIDFGNERNVDKSALYSINEQLVVFPPQAVRCCLKGFENTTSLSDSATVQLEMLAETNDNERRHFKCTVFDQLEDTTYLVNLIDDTIRPELNLMKRLYKLSMPFNKYINLEKDTSTTTQPLSSRNDSVNTHQKANPCLKHASPYSEELYTPQQQSTSEWDANSSGSSEIRENTSSPTSSQGKRTRNRASPNSSFQKDSYKNKSNMPPRFQKQNSDTKGRNKENHFIQQQPIYNTQKEYNNDSGKNNYNSISSSKQLGTTSDSCRSSSPTPDVIEIHEYLPFDVNLPEQTVNTPSRSEVIVCWWISPHQFYIHKKSRISEFENMMKRIQAFYKTIPPSDIHPGVGSNIIARYKQDNILYRAKVLASNETLRKYRVLFTDFGNQSTVDSNDIWAIEKRFSIVPIMCQLCSFDGVISNYDHKYITTAVEKYLTPKANLYCNFQRKDNDVYLVDIEVNGKSLKDSLVEDGILSLINEDIEIELLLGQQVKAKIESVQDLLNFQIQIDNCDLKFMCSYNDIKLIRSNPHLSSEFKKGYEGKLCVFDVVDVSKEKILMVQPLIPLFNQGITTKICDYPIITRSLNVKVLYIKNENILYVHSTSVENTLFELVDNMFNFYDNGGENLSDFKIGNICAAKSEDENWYRARIIAKASDTVEVSYIDYGNTEIIQDRSKLKKLETKFCDLNALSIRVYLPLKSIKQGDEAVINEIKSLTDGIELNLKILEVYKKKWIVDILCDDYSMIDVLADKEMSGRDIEYVKNIIDNEKQFADAPIQESSKNLLKNNNCNEKSSVRVASTENIVLESQDQEKNKLENNADIITTDVKTIETCSQEDSSDEEWMKDMTKGYLSHCDNPGRFFIQLESTYSELTKLQDNLQIVAGSLPQLTNYSDGALCIALYSVDETWYRAKIIDSEIMVIQFIDYGNTDVITDNSYIKEMNEAFAKTEPFAIQCALAIAPKDTVDWVDEANSVFSGIYDKTVYFDYITHEEPKKYIHLKVEGEDIAENLIKSNMARPLEVLRSGENCFVSHINSLSDFYVQMENDSSGLELIADLLANYETFPLVEKQETGITCAAIFPDDSEWYRAKILSRENDEMNVLFIDYGNTSVTPEARKISPELENLPPLSKKCSLRMPEYILGWSDAAEAKFTELSAMGQTVFRIKLVEPGDHAIVDLYIEDRNILDELEKLCDKRPPIPGRENTGKSSKKEKQEERIRKNVYISHVNSPLEFYVQLSNEVAAIEEITNELIDADKYEKLENLEIGTICGAIYPLDGALYRARILSHSDCGTQVNFIDFGNNAVSNDLRILPEHLKVKKSYAKLCSLDDQDIDFTTPQAIEIFNALIANGEDMECEVTREIQSLWIVKLYKEKNDLAIELGKQLKGKNIETTEKLVDEIANEINGDLPDDEKNESLLNSIVSHINFHGDFYVQLDVKSDELDKMLDELEKAEAFDKLKDYSVGSLCAAVFVDDGAFYRGRIVSEKEKGYEVLFIDYGNCAISEDLRELPQHLKEVDGLAKHCTLEKNTKYDNNLEASNEHFNSLVRSHFGETFQIKILEKLTDPWTVKLFHNNVDISIQLEKLVTESEESKGEQEVWNTLNNESDAGSTTENSNVIETEPTVEPTVEPKVEPIVEPTVETTVKPTVEPTVETTVEPTVEQAPLEETKVEKETDLTEKPATLDTSLNEKEDKGLEEEMPHPEESSNTEPEIITSEATQMQSDDVEIKIVNDTIVEDEAPKEKNSDDSGNCGDDNDSKDNSFLNETNKTVDESFNDDILVTLSDGSKKGSDKNVSSNDEKILSSEELGNKLWENMHSLGIADKTISASETNLSKPTSDISNTNSTKNLNIPNTNDLSKSCINLH